MAQADYSISNQGFPATRADINSHLQAIATNNSGTSAPSTQYAGQFWIDTTSSTWTLYIHDGADDIQFATIDTSANTVNFIDSELGDNSVTTAKIEDGNVTSAKLSYPLTTFSSTGIDDNATSTAITIDSSENVGIGTTSPSSTLHVESSTGSTLLKATGTDTGVTLVLNGNKTSNTAGIGSIQFQNNGDSVGMIRSFRESANDAGGLYFSTQATGGSNTERMRIDSSGNVGIGTTSPSQKLDVVGSIEVSDGIYIGGTGTANKLDDYEEGNVDGLGFETTNSDINVTLDRNRGKYVKIGKQVNVTGVLRTSAVTSKGTGSLLVTGLPFTVDNTYQRGEATGVFNGYYRWVNSPALCKAIDNTTTLELIRNSGSSSTTLTPSSDLWDLSYPSNWCDFTITYYTT